MWLPYVSVFISKFLSISQKTEVNQRKSCESRGYELPLLFYLLLIPHHRDSAFLRPTSFCPQFPITHQQKMQKGNTLQKLKVMFIVCSGVINCLTVLTVA